MTMEPLTILILLMWQIGKLWQLYEDRRWRRRHRAFWERHRQNIEAIRAGMPLPYPNNSVDWPESETHKRN